jgi:hypothetical protein
MRPVLNPALRRFWRDFHTLQFGLHPRHAVLLGRLTPAYRQLLTRLDGCRDLADALAAAAELGIPPGDAAQVLTELAKAGVVVDVDSSPAALPDLDVPVRQRLAPDAATLALLRGVSAGAMFRRRQQAYVEVTGSGRLAAPLAALLQQAGVGAVTPRLLGRVGPTEPALGGFVPADRGRPRATAAHYAQKRAAPEGRRPRHGQRADLLVHASSRPLLTEAARQLRLSGVPHLAVTVRETIAVVGPLVLPGRTACLACADRHRIDRDPRWPVIAVQAASLSSVDPCETALAATTVGLAGLQALAYLDGRGVSVLDAVLELDFVTAGVTRLPAPPHPACCCRD